MLLKLDLCISRETQNNDTLSVEDCVSRLHKTLARSYDISSSIYEFDSYGKQNTIYYITYHENIVRVNLIRFHYECLYVLRLNRVVDIPQKLSYAFLELRNPADIEIIQ